MCEKCRLMELLDRELERWEVYHGSKALANALHLYAIERRDRVIAEAREKEDREMYEQPDPLSEWKALEPGRKVLHLPTKTVWTITRVGDYGTHIVSDDSGDEIFLVSSNNPLRYYRILPVTTRSFFRGHPVIKSADGAWIYEDSGEPAGFDGTIRPCKKCGLIFDGSDAGHPDPCLGNLPGVDNACCGHGVRSEAYIRFANGVVIRGFEIDRQREASHD
jgi:hypothetical protein